MRYARDHGLPAVTAGRVLGQGEGDRHWVDNDHVAGFTKMLDHLAALGSERIALVAPLPFASYVEDVRLGYGQWCSANGRQVLIATASSVSESGGFRAATELLDREDPPDAIYAALDRPALGVLLSAHARGLRVSDDLSVAACTDTPASRAADPPLTTLNLNAQLIGTAAVEMLIELVEGRGLAELQRIVPTEVIVRGSTQGRPLEVTEGT